LKDRLEDTNLHQRVSLENEYCIRRMVIYGLKHFLILVMQGIREIKSALLATVITLEKIQPHGEARSKWLFLVPVRRLSTKLWLTLIMR